MIGNLALQQNSAPLLEVRELTVNFASSRGQVRALAGVSFDLQAGETLGLVGESGCGKTVTAMAILRLLPHPQAKIMGSVRFQGEDLLSRPEEQMRSIRGNHIAMVFQEPMTALNPVLTIGEQVAEVLRLHRGLKNNVALQEAAAALSRVGLAEPEQRLRQFPHQLSGGLRQRVLMAMALACGPSLLIADEPTTALDVTIQAQILALLKTLKAELNLSVLFITHNLGIVAQTADRVAVMYAGLIVEQAATVELFTHPGHPYTRGLLASVPLLNFRRPPGAPLEAVKGHLPAEPPPGCLFKDRCPEARRQCETPPPWVEIAPDHWVRCWNYA
ncbi:MAG: ABC transporter ATP-binding protein [Deltaproteobacteria bacterium]|nr:ABC transporter ATP-binding protein [Deltaproteobacteria bacterium]